MTLFSLLMLSLPANAARQAKMTLDDVILRSGRILEATVIGHDMFAGGTASPKTKVTLRVDWSPSVDAGSSTLELWLPEGVEATGDTWSGYDGVPTFAPGERYLLFLHLQPWRISPVVNWTWGHLRALEVGGVALYVDMQGACAVHADEAGIKLGPRVALPPSVPGHGSMPSSVLPNPSMAPLCKSSHDIRLKIEGRIAALDWTPTVIQAQPTDWSEEMPLMGVSP